MGLFGWVVIRPSDRHSSGGTESVRYRIGLCRVPYRIGLCRVEVWILVVLKDWL